MPVRVLLVDDQVLFRTALSALLATWGELEVVGEVADGEAALRLADKLRPDVVVLDARLPGMDGIETTRLLRQAHPRTAVLLLSGFADEATQSAAARAGAVSTLDKGRLTSLRPEIQAAARSVGVGAVG
jgi:DNA-binding NarL/FixJ family response regulator